jgi:hypothetical protein
VVLVDACDGLSCLLALGALWDLREALLPAVIIDSAHAITGIAGGARERPWWTLGKGMPGR